MLPLTSREIGEGGFVSPVYFVILRLRVQRLVRDVSPPFHNVFVLAAGVCFPRFTGDGEGVIVLFCHV